jgi:DNA-binding NarL/FixJ family response regulator
MSQPIQIAIIDDHMLFRNGLAALLTEFAELQIVFQANNGRQMQELIATLPAPNVVLMDVNMPSLDGIATTAWLKAHYPDVQVLALSMFNEEKEVIAMLRSGASGYLVKDSDPKQLLEAIKAVHQHGIYLNEMVSGKLLHSVMHNRQQETFSSRELEFLRYCCTELTYKEIANQMNVSVRTIDNYRDALFNRLFLRSRTGLVLYCIKNRIVNLSD